MKKIRVLCVDDSAIIRQLLKETIPLDTDVEVVGTARDCFAARDMIKRYKPDVLTLDIEMPNMTGLEFLSFLMRVHPMPVIMFSSAAQRGSDAALTALSMGAVDVVAKPGAGTSVDWLGVVGELVTKIKLASRAKLDVFTKAKDTLSEQPQSKLTKRWPKGRVVGIGASTGGVQAIRSLLEELPSAPPPLLIAQHMPASFTSSFARRLNLNSAITVHEAKNGQPIRPGEAYVGPGDHHLVVDQTDEGLVCRLRAPAPTDKYIPSVDTLFISLAKHVGSSAMGVVLTGMGRDGAEGLSHIRDAGGSTAAQDEGSSLIYGMPKAAVDLGVADRQLPLSKIGRFITGPKVRRSQKEKLEKVSS